MATVINDVKQLLIKNAKNGDFELNLATGGGGGGSLEPLIVTATHTGDTTTDKGYYTLYHSDAVTYSHSYEEVMDAIAEGREVILKESSTTQTLGIKRYSSSSIFFERTQTNYLSTNNNPRAVIDTYFFSLLKSSSKQGKYTRVSAKLDEVNKPFYPIIEFDEQMQVTKIEQGVVSAMSGTVIGRAMGTERAFSVISLMDVVQSQAVYRYFVALDGVVFELNFNSENEITSVRSFSGGIYVCTVGQLAIHSKEIKTASVTYASLVEVDPDTSEETRTRFMTSQGGKKAVRDSQIVPLNYGLGYTFLYNRTDNDITFDADSELYYITSI